MNALMTKIFGVNWEGKFAALIIALTGLGQLAIQLNMTDTKTGQIMTQISVAASFISVTYAHLKQKSSDVTGSGAGAVKGENVSNIDKAQNPN